jgi:hypothetical protein
MKKSMDIRQALAVVRAFFGRSFRAAKLIVTLPYFKTYAALSLGLTAVFVILTFPYGELLKNRIKTVEGGMIKAIDVATLDISLIGESSAEGISITPALGDELTIQSAVLDGNINPYSLFVSRDFRGSLLLNNLAYRSANVEFDATINCNYALAFLSSALDRGSLKIIMEKTGLKLNDINLPFSASAMKLSLPYMKFSSVIATVNLAKDTVTIQQMKLSGQDLQGSVSGSINLARVILNSRIDITVTIDAESTVLAQYRDMLASYINSDGQMVFSVEGTFARPRLQRKGGKMELDEN